MFSCGTVYTRSYTPPIQTEQNLVAGKQEIFESHTPNLPIFQRLVIHNELAVALIAERQGYFKHGVANIVSHKNGVLCRTKSRRFAGVSRMNLHDESVIFIRYEKLLGSIFGAQAVACIHVRLPPSRSNSRAVVRLPFALCRVPGVVEGNHSLELIYCRRLPASLVPAIVCNRESGRAASLEPRLA